MDKDRHGEAAKASAAAIGTKCKPVMPPMEKPSMKEMRGDCHTEDGRYKR